MGVDLHDHVHRPAPARARSSTASPTCAAPPSTAASSTRPRVAGGRIPLPDLAAENVLVVEAAQSDTASGVGHPAHGRPLRRAGLRLDVVRGRRRPPGLGLLRPARPEGAARVHGAAPASLDGHQQRRAPLGRGRRPTDGAALDVPGHAAALDVRRGGQRRPLPRAAPRGRRAQPGAVLPPVAARVPRARRRRPVRGSPRPGLAFFGERFGQPFPQERYDQVFVPNMGGAMENWGCVTWTDAVLFRSPPTHGQRAMVASVLLHEMAHMWFGDLVTMRWWDDLWLNEAFASWAADLGRRARHRVHRRLGELPGRGRDRRLRDGHGPGLAPDPRRRARRGARDGELRRDHLRQGPGRAPPAGRHGR